MQSSEIASLYNDSVQFHDTRANSHCKLHFAPATKPRPRTIVLVNDMPLKWDVCFHFRNAQYTGFTPSIATENGIVCVASYRTQQVSHTNNRDENEARIVSPRVTVAPLTASPRTRLPFGQASSQPTGWPLFCSSSQLVSGSKYSIMAPASMAR